MRRAGNLLLLALGAACASSTDPPEPRPPRAFAPAGNHQSGNAGQQLPIPLAVTVVNANGAPVVGASVFWDGVHNGLVEPLGATTDADGRVRARFVLGDTEGIASLYAAVVNVDSVPFQLDEVRRSTDGITWGPPTRLTLAHDGLYPWHVEVQWIRDRGEFWTLYNAKQAGSCTTPALFLATSVDGLRVTPVRRPVVAKGADPALQDIVYRSTFSYDPAEDDLRLWVSGARFERSRWTWSTLLIRKHRPSLFDKLHADLPAPVFPAPPAELVDWP